MASGGVWTTNPPVRSKDVKARRAQRIGFCLSLALPVAAICFGCHGLPPSAVDRILKSEHAYRIARYDESQRLATSVIRSYPEEPDTAEAYYLRGLARVRSGDRAEANGDFRQAVRLCERSDLKSVLSTQLAHMLFEDHAFAGAARLYNQALKGPYPENCTPGLWFRYALSLERSGAFCDARSAFQRVADQRTDARLSSAASTHLAWRHSYFTLQCGAYTRAERARAAAKMLKERGLDAAVVRSGRPGVASHLVHAGRYPDYVSARAALADIRRVQPDAFVIP